ncbi:hypothetical protein ES703_56365 [subsurface metagenome]
MYFSRVKVPNAPKPSEKLPNKSIITGQTVKNPTMTMKLGTKGGFIRGTLPPFISAGYGTASG